ncbi:MAG: stage III sporulation protein AF [Thermaerobacter sp.]|nr:stage III sporulation protein AF [Thermaerobacter sp.]
MDWLSWLRGILVVALFGWLFEALQPASAMKRYTRLAIGLLLMVAILHPIVTLLGSRLPTLAKPFWTDGDVQGLLQQGVFLQQREQKAAQASYQEALSRAAMAAVLGVQGVQKAQVQVTLSASEAPESANVQVVVASGGPATLQAVRKAAATALGISQGSVRVSWTEGGVGP